MQLGLWGLALVLDAGGPFLFGAEGWKLVPGHFAERHGAIVIIALGESIVAIGVGAKATIDAGIVVAAVLGDRDRRGHVVGRTSTSPRSSRSRRLAKAPEGRERNEIARDSYSYLHFPMVAGIALIAVGIQRTIVDVDEPLKLVPAVALLGGAATYLFAHVAFRLRNMHSLSTRRLVCACVLLALVPAGASLARAAYARHPRGGADALIAYEALRYADVRDRVRHQLAREPT